MGREWNWSGRSSRKRGGFCREDEEEAEAAAYSSGCWSSIFHLFDFHPTQYALNHHRRPSFQDYHSPLPTGVEAPRNSLDLEELPLPWISADEGSQQLPMGMKIKTRGSDGSTKNSKAGGGLNNDYFTDNSNINSPSARTPNLVARLMGLDLLPESSSPSSSSSSVTFSNRHSKSQLNRLTHGCKYQEKLHGRPRIFLDPENILSSRSLPETPRVSLARKSNVDYHHRLSLQDEDHQVEILSGFKRKDVLMMNDENRSPNEYAKQILRQVKENVSRKAGFDITNTIKNGDFSQKVGCKRNPGEKFRFMEFKNSKEQISKVAVKQKLKPKTRDSHKNAQKVNDHKKFSPRKKKAQIEEPCVRPSKAAKAINKHCRKTPLSNHLLSFNNVVVPTLILPIRTDLHSSTTKPPKKQISNVQESKHKSELSGSSSQMYRQKPTEGNDKKDIEIGYKPETNSTSTTNNGRSELEYVSGILSRTLFSKDTEGHVQNSTAISGHSNGKALCYSDRKLLSDLTDELLRETLRNEETFRKNDGLKIITTILKRIKSFPRAKCEVLEDLDSLIEGDLGKSKFERGLKIAMEEGVEEIVREIEKDTTEKLVHEVTNTAMAFCFSVQ